MYTFKNRIVSSRTLRAAWRLCHVSHEGVRTRELTMTDNLSENDPENRKKKILGEILYQAYVLLATDKFGCKVYNVYF